MRPAHDFDFGDARFDFDRAEDRELLTFILSQALYGEATGVYCGRSLYNAGSLEAAHFYARQARQELAHLGLFADIVRLLELTPEPAHWAVRALSAHNDYYPLKVLMEHALGEGMVLDIFRDVLLQTLPEGDPRSEAIAKKLRVICKEEEEHIAWGEKETLRILAEQPELRTPFYGLLELVRQFVPLVVRGLEKKAPNHPVVQKLDEFVVHVQDKLWRQGQKLGIAPAPRPRPSVRAVAMARGLALLGRSKLARSESKLDKRYLEELGFR